MYCVKCGVKLQDDIKECPLCGTPSWRPDTNIKEDKQTYPDNMPKAYKNTNVGALIVISVIVFLAILVELLVCFRIYGEINWGGIATGGIILAYVITVLPQWFQNPNPVIFVPVDHVAAGGYVLFICLNTGGHWFLSFAFPIIGISCIISTTIICLLKYTRGGRIFIFGSLFIALGGSTMLIEFFEHITFNTEMFLWSIYPASSLFILGIFIIIAGIIKPLRIALEKLFFY